MGCYLGLESCIEKRLNTPNIAYIIIIFVIVLDVHPSNYRNLRVLFSIPIFGSTRQSVDVL